MAGFVVLLLSILASFLINLQPSAANLYCKESYGVVIDYDNCIEALATLQAQLLSPGGGLAVQTFSRQTNLARKLQHMPQAFAWKTCSIGIDLADPVPPDGTVLSNWGRLTDHLLQLLQTCVQRHGIGGRLMVDGFDIIVISSRAGIGYETCLVQPKQHSMSLGRCIDGRAQMKERLALAGMQRPATPPYAARNAPSFLQPETMHPFMGPNMPPYPLVVQHGYPQDPPAAPHSHSQTYNPPLAMLDHLHRHQPFVPQSSAVNMVQPAGAQPYMSQVLQPPPGRQYGNSQRPERPRQHLRPPPPARPSLARPQPPPSPPRVMRPQYLVQGQPIPLQATGRAQAPPRSSSLEPSQTTPASAPVSVPVPKES